MDALLQRLRFIDEVSKTSVVGFRVAVGVTRACQGGQFRRTTHVFLLGLLILIGWPRLAVPTWQKLELHITRIIIISSVDGVGGDDAIFLVIVTPLAPIWQGPRPGESALLGLSHVEGKQNRAVALESLDVMPPACIGHVVEGCSLPGVQGEVPVLSRGVPCVDVYTGCLSLRRQWCGDRDSPLGVVASLGGCRPYLPAQGCTPTAALVPRPGRATSARHHLLATSAGPPCLFAALRRRQRRGTSDASLVGGSQSHASCRRPVPTRLGGSQ